MKSAPSTNTGDTSEREYEIVSSAWAGVLSDLVQDMLRDGYEPCGGVCVTLDRNGQQNFYQSVWKR